MNKKFFYLIGIPRCGNTILRSILNQNPDLYQSHNSVVPEMLFKLYQCKFDPLFKEQADHKAFDDALGSVMDGYYKNIKAKYILERAPWGTPFNYELLSELKRKTKFVALVRPVEEILASYVRVVKPDDIESFCDMIMQEDGAVGKSLWSINYVKDKSPKSLLQIKYDDLCKNPKKEITKIYKHLGIPLFKHRFEKLDESTEAVVSEQNIIRTDKVKRISYKPDKYITRKIIRKYKNAFSPKSPFFYK